MKNTTFFEQVREQINAGNGRSAWSRGVKEYALELLDTMEDAGRIPASRGEALEICLNGAGNWSRYSWGGCSLIYNSEIAERLCTPSELKKRRGGEWRPNRGEEWLDVQARALNQAFRRLYGAVRLVQVVQGV